MDLIPNVITYGLVALGFFGTLVAVVGLTLED